MPSARDELRFVMTISHGEMIVVRDHSSATSAKTEQTYLKGVPRYRNKGVAIVFRYSTDTELAAV